MLCNYQPLLEQSRKELSKHMKVWVFWGGFFFRFWFFFSPQLFPCISEEAKAFQSFRKTNKRNRIPFLPSLDKQIALYQDASLVVKVPRAKRELEFGFLASPFFHIPGAQCGLNSIICHGREQILLGENFMAQAC